MGRIKGQTGHRQKRERGNDDAFHISMWGKAWMVGSSTTECSQLEAYVF